MKRGLTVGSHGAARLEVHGRFEVRPQTTWHVHAAADLVPLVGIGTFRDFVTQAGDALPVAPLDESRQVLAAFHGVHAERAWFGKCRKWIGGLVASEQQDSFVNHVECDRAGAGSTTGSSQRHACVNQVPRVILLARRGNGNGESVRFGIHSQRRVPHAVVGRAHVGRPDFRHGCHTASQQVHGHICIRKELGLDRNVDHRHGSVQLHYLLVEQPRALHGHKGGGLIERALDQNACHIAWLIDLLVCLQVQSVAIGMSPTCGRGRAVRAIVHGVNPQAREDRIVQVILGRCPQNVITRLVESQWARHFAIGRSHRAASRLDVANVSLVVQDIRGLVLDHRRPIAPPELDVQGNVGKLLSAGAERQGLQRKLRADGQKALLWLPERNVEFGWVHQNLASAGLRLLANVLNIGFQNELFSLSLLWRVQGDCTR